MTTNKIDIQKNKSIVYTENAKLYLIPTTMGETDLDTILPNHNSKIIKELKYFIVENIRTARRFLKKVDKNINIDELTFFELNKHTDEFTIVTFLNPLKKGYSIGVISEAGCPAVADPGANIVALAQQENYDVVPLVGPSSILLSLMASGFNGQSFAFYGYLPIQQADKINMLKKLESKIYSEHQTQIFIETPYRNLKMFDDIIRTCRPDTKLCIATDITLSTEFIKTKPIHAWKREKPSINKRPTVFLLYK